jgi:hypothetical protein
MFRKEFFDKINGYDVTLRAGGDYDFWVRLSKVCKLHNIQKQLIKYRVHDDSISSKKAKLQRECRTQVSSTAIMEYCGFSPRFNMAFIKTGSLLELEKLHDELNKMFSIICKRFPDTSVQLFIEADIKNILHSEISCFSYREKLNSIISSNIPINLKKRIMLAIPNKIKSILKKEKTLY